MTGVMKIGDILAKSGKRHRQDYGDLDGLAESIAAVGLLHPVVVNSDGRLIAGARRIMAAAQKLGWTEIPRHGRRS
jgi:ParB family chromosome partitioning protein